MKGMLKKDVQIFFFHFLFCCLKNKIKKNNYRAKYNSLLNNIVSIQVLINYFLNIKRSNVDKPNN